MRGWVKWLAVLFVGVMVSMFYFPITFTAFPATNTKNLLAALGLVAIFLVFVYKQEFSLPREVLVLLLLSALVSVASLMAVIYNHTPDDSYVTYIRSAIIWLSAAFVVCLMIRILHGRIDVPLVVNYLVGVSLFQCAMAMLIEFNPAVRQFVDAHIEQNQGLLQELGRLYGIGASLDVGGSRFAAVLCAIAGIVIVDRDKMPRWQTALYLLAFAFITVIGNMIARTTIVGTGIGLAFMFYFIVRDIFRVEKGGTRLAEMWGVALAIAVPLAVVLYRTIPEVEGLMRFGFEGFFNMFENGEWHTDSGGKLMGMYVFPETMKTWIIGDGYFENSRNDINYLGTATDRGFYMGTDVGYLRFIFYAGLIGLAAISAVMLYAGVIGGRYFPRYKCVPYLGVLVNFIVWFKVATDLFPFLVLFVAAAIISEEFPAEDQEEIT